jgi:PAS domain S-box-containing protein
MSIKNSPLAFEEIGQAIVNNNLMGIFVIQDNKLIYSNNKFAEFYGFYPNELIGKEYYLLVHPDDRARSARIMAKILITLDKQHRYKIRGLKKSGKSVYCELMMSGTEYGGKPAIIGVINSSKNRENDFRKIGEFNSILIDKSPIAVVVLNSDTSIRYMNSAMETLTGFLLSKYIGTMAPYPWWTNETRFKSKEDFQKLMYRGTNKFEEVFRKQNGEKLWVEITSSPVIVNTKMKFFISNLVDITERKLMELELKKHREHLEDIVIERTNELKKAQKHILRQERLAIMGQLAGSVSHELRNPLGVIKNVSYFLDMVVDKSNKDVKEAIEILNNEINMSERIVASLLDFGRSGNMYRQHIDIKHLIEETLSRISVPNNIVISKELSMELTKIFGDPVKLDMVFRNLILNAIEAMPTGGKLTIKSRIKDIDSLLVSIADTGAGIDEYEFDEIFEPLYSRKAKGIGLGLSIARIFIEQHGGTIHVHSSKGEGSTFTVELPI